LTVGSGDLRFVASQDLGPLGTTEASPVDCAWRWPYHLPYLGLWGLLAGALVVPRENRRGQAWLILVPLFLVSALWKMPVTLIHVPSSSANFLGLLLTSLAMAWTVVWLVEPWLRRRGRPASLVWTWGVMLLIGALSYFSDYGVGVVSRGASFVSEAVPFLITFGAFTLALLLAMKISRLSCRKRYRPGSFMVWLFLWLFLTCAAGISLWLGLMMLVVNFSLTRLAMTLVIAGVVAGPPGTLERGSIGRRVNTPTPFKLSLKAN
jgi:hypothetical protein